MLKEKNNNLKVNIIMKQLKNFLIKREQSQACLSFAKREKSRLLAKTLLTLVALIAVTTGAWADGKVINSEIDYESLKVGDILVEGFSISGLYSTKFYFNAGRAKKGETLLNEDVSFFKGYISSVGTNTVITLSADAGDAAGIYTPIDENGQVANAWIVTSSNAQGNSDFHLSGYTYVDPNAATGPEVAWDKAKKTGTFSMPAGNVELEPEYYPQAALTAAPTAINDVPATTDGAILKAGTVATIGSTEQAQGTVMYYVSPTALDDAALLALAADQWKADVPTAADLAQGQAYVYYYVRGNDSDTDDETFSDGDILAANALTVTIAAAPTYAVTFAEGTDANEWTASPATDVTKGQTVTVTYTGSKKVLGVKAEKKSGAASLIVNPVVGQIIGSDGKNYDANATLPDGVKAVAVIAYVGSETYDATFKNGLAIALADEAKSNWSTAMSTCEGKTAITGAKWCLPSQDQWKQMFKANGGNEGSYTGLNTTITNAGGTILQGSVNYWSSSEYNPGVRAYFVYLANGDASWSNATEGSGFRVRACLAF